MSEMLRDRHGDVWILGSDGLMHTPETAPFSREHVERKWGPLVRVADLLAPTGWHNIDGWCDDCEAGTGDCVPL